MQQVYQQAYHYGHCQLNLSQYNAVEASLCNKLALIQGPPGTGKSHTIGEIVLLARQLGIGPVRVLTLLRTLFQILLAASTHSAVDSVSLHVLDRLTKAGREAEFIRYTGAGTDGITKVDPGIRHRVLENVVAAIAKVSCPTIS